MRRRGRLGGAWYGGGGGAGVGGGAPCNAGCGAAGQALDAVGRPSSVSFCSILARLAVCVEENEGVPVFLYTFWGKKSESVEENEGVAVFLYTFDQNHQQTTTKRSWPAASDSKPSGVGLRPTDDTEAEAPQGGASFWNDRRKEVGPSPTSSLFLFHMEGQPEAAPLLWYAVEVGRRSPPFRSDFCGFLSQ